MINNDKIDKYKQSFVNSETKLKILLYRTSINTIEVYDALKFSHHLEVFIYDCDSQCQNNIKFLEDKLLSEQIDIIFFTQEADAEIFRNSKIISKKMVYNQPAFTETITPEKYKTIKLEKFPNTNELLLDFFTDYTRETIWSYVRLVDTDMVETVIFEPPSELLMIISDIRVSPLPHGYFSITLKLDEFGNIANSSQTTCLSYSLKLYRSYGINVPLMLIQDYLGRKLKVIDNQEFLKNKLVGRRWLEIEFNHFTSSIYVDLDGTLISGNNVNTKVLALIYIMNSIGLEVYLITRHKIDPLVTLGNNRIKESIFKGIIHITDGSLKSNYISSSSILIDNEFPERYDSYTNKNILAIDVDFVDLVINNIIKLNYKRYILI
jgi:hypothetical protein